MTTVLVVGGGPAGRALAAECAVRGLPTTLVDRSPDAPWRVTYGAWLDELPPGLPPLAATAVGRVVARAEHTLDRTYAVLDVPALRAHLDARMAAAGVHVVAGRVTGRATSDAWPADRASVGAGGGPDGGSDRRPGSGSGGRAGRSDREPGRGSGGSDGRSDARPGVVLADGTELRADVLVDAGGHRAPLRGSGRSERVAAEQTAYGLVVPAAVAAPLVSPGEALFMDWRPDHGEPGWPTFLYAVPLGGGTVLLEETSLARRPGLALPVLHRRLLARLAHHGITPPADAPVERVRFPVDLPRHVRADVLGFGAAAPLIHPASGFSAADTLRLAPVVAEALAERGLAAAQQEVWSARSVAVHRLRSIGLEALLRMPSDAVPDFFETFFALPERHLRAYLSGRTDLTGLVAAMNALFLRADGRLRARLVGAAFLPAAPALGR